MLVIWSAKCASSTTIVWCLSTVGLLDDVLASGLTPHDYRGNRYPLTEVSKRSSAKIIDDCWIVHVIRDPYLRAVSSYRHTLATGYADKRLKLLQRPRLDRQPGFSFAQFLDYLETIDLKGANIHHKLQVHPIEAIKPADHVINISRQNLLSELNRIEAEHGMPVTDFRTFGRLLTREGDRRAKVSPVVGNAAELPLNVAAAMGRLPWPEYEQFLDPATKRRIERLYAPDFEAFAPYL